MHVRSRTLPAVVGLSLSMLVAVAADVGPGTRAQAQIRDGEFGLVQSQGLVGWAYASADHSREYWAYFETYSFASPANTEINPWKLQSTLVSSAAWPSYDAWKANVLARAESRGHILTFQNHSVVEEVVAN